MQKRLLNAFAATPFTALAAAVGREEDNIALVLSSLVLVVTLPILTYSFVRFFALR